jgi:hypothetical protein
MNTHALKFVLLATAFVSVDAWSSDFPDPDKTPGVKPTDVSDTRICEIKWGLDARHVTKAMKREVFQSYGLSGNDDPRCIRDAPGRKCEIDHLISRELGGADDVKNLWPQAYGTSPWNAQLKDKLENRLHKEACEKQSIKLRQARKWIVEDWRVAYRKYYGRP